MRHSRLLITLALIIAALAAPLLFFLIRPPVLVVTDAPFAALYGEDNLKRRQTSASLSLFRRVKPVMVADGASPDIVLAAIAEASKRPLCVLFARSQALAALRFHEQFPKIPAVVLRGLARVAEIPSPDNFLCVYSTDREVDLYRAGLFAGILGNMPQKPEKKIEEDGAPAKASGDKAAPPDESAEKTQNTPQKTYVLWQDNAVQAAGRELFSGGVQEEAPESVVVFVNSAAGMPDMKAISCVVLTGAGAEYLEKGPSMPLVLFSWVDPALTAKEVVVLFDDSVWALTAAAVRMALKQQAEAKLPSRALILSEKIADNSVFRALRKSAKKMPLKDI